jgi:hypothetical protein
MQNCVCIADAKFNLLAALRQLTPAWSADDADRVITIDNARMRTLETHGGTRQCERAQTPNCLQRRFGLKRNIRQGLDIDVDYASPKVLAP